MASVPDRFETAQERQARESNVVPLPEPMPRPLDWEALEEAGEPPARDWLIDHWIGRGYVTGLFGKGGLGKSLLAQQLCTNVCLGRAFIGQVSTPRNALMWMAEDDAEELWRRQDAICRSIDVKLGTLRNRLTVVALADQDCTLLAAAELSRTLVRTKRLETLREQIGDLQIELLVLDNIARLFGGSENDRHHVTMFLAALTYAAAPTKAAIILVGHTAKMAGSEFAGSTAWENACRGRLWLTDKPPDAPDEEREPDPETVYLAKRKMNYGSKDLVLLRRKSLALAGYFEQEGGIITLQGMAATIDKRNTERVIIAAMAKLSAMGYPHLSSSSRSGNWLPKLIIDHGLHEGRTRLDLSRTVNHMMSDGTIRMEQVGLGANRHPIMGLTVAPSANA